MLGGTTFERYQNEMSSLLTVADAEKKV